MSGYIEEINERIWIVSDYVDEWLVRFSDGAIGTVGKQYVETLH